jgi:hypothetical protein
MIYNIYNSLASLLNTMPYRHSSLIHRSSLNLLLNTRPWRLMDSRTIRVVIPVVIPKSTPCSCRTARRPHPLRIHPCSCIRTNSRRDGRIPLLRLLRLLRLRRRRRVPRSRHFVYRGMRNVGTRDGTRGCRTRLSVIPIL